MLKFIFGLLIGSFLNVLSIRYREDVLVFGKQIGGRSHCPKCGKQLSWYELIPVFSFVFQLGRCRSCKEKISWQYPVVEILSGLIFFFIPNFTGSIFASVLWVIVFETLLLIALIDLKLKIIPDELNILLLVCGVALIAGRQYAEFGGHYNVLLGSLGSGWGTSLFGAILLSVLFGSIIALTKGQGMGMGDLKFSIPLGILFGLLGSFLVFVISFISGALISLAVIFLKRGNRKTALPFGPFLVFAATVVFFWSEEVLNLYFTYIGGIGLKLFGA